MIAPEEVVEIFNGMFAVDTRSWGLGVVSFCDLGGGYYNIMT
jgi:hypothetical protein